MKIITIQTKDGSKPMSAYVYGIFAVHRQYSVGEWMSDNWCVTHIPTGLAMCQSFDKCKDAQTVIKNVLKIIPKTCKLITSCTPEEIVKDETSKAVARYLNIAARTYRYSDLEDLAGVFYGDRAEMEKVLQSIKE